jgi:WD40 repeat protein
MTPRLLLTGIVIFFPVRSVAAPPPKEVTVTPITARNADQLRKVGEVSRAVFRIVKGPGRGELTVYDLKGEADVVTDTGLDRIREEADGLKPQDLAFGRGGKLTAWIEHGKTAYTVLDGKGNRIAIEIGEHAGRAAFSPDGTQIAIGYTDWRAAGGGHSEVRVFDLTGKLLRTLEKTGPGAVHPVYSPNGKVLAVGNRNHVTLLFDAATGQLLHKLEKRMIQEIAFAPDSTRLAAGYVDGTVGVWDVRTGKLIASGPSGCKEVYSLDWNKDGDVLATTGLNGPTVLWDPATLTKLKELEAQYWSIQVRFTADGGRIIAAGSGDHSAKTERKVIIYGLKGGDGK